MSTTKPLALSEHYAQLSPLPAYGECKTEIIHDLFPTELYRQLQWMKDRGMGDYKVGGSAALKLATADTSWENDDVDIMVHTTMNTIEYAKKLGLTNLVKSWTKGVDPNNPDREERFHDSIYQVLTFRRNDFDKKIQLVFFKKFNDSSFTNFLDRILDYPAHVLYEVNFDKDDKKTYNFFLPVQMWENISQKRIPRNLHCMKSEERIQKYMKRGFEFFTIKNTLKSTPDTFKNLHLVLRLSKGD
jgi:hypothetical protein